VLRVLQSMIARLVRRLKCRLRWCPGHVVSGTHQGVIHIGWQCDICGKVKYYSPDRAL
jgi:hypothetical protein